MHPAALPPDELLARCDTQRSRGSGPGGQHRNKVETAVTLTDPATGISAQASERRSQQQNRSAALKRLRVKLAIHHRTPGGLPGRSAAPPPSDLWRSRVKDKRIACNVDHADYPALLAEAMDHLAWCNLAPADAAKRLGVSTSQLIKLISKEPAALEQVNRDREARGMKRLQKR